MRTFKRWLSDMVSKIGMGQVDIADAPAQSFTAEVVGTAQKLRVERDHLYPGHWHVIEPNDKVWLEYRVQTDEWIENGSIDWALCNCPEGKMSRSQVSHCAHVAAVLLAMVEELNK